MKKILMLLTMVMMLGFSAVCSASNGKLLDAEEAAAQKFFNGGSFKVAGSVFGENMKKNWDEKSYNNFKDAFAKEFGKVLSSEMAFLEKRGATDVLVYQIKTEKVPVARVAYLFSVNGDKAFLEDFNIILPQKEQAKAAEEKK
ncbi:MAG: hypothetical protein SPI71_06870 [Acidaminococcaceae bacterium]|nr:hypothetical protein [Acidaminococcaceae bacterium]